ncbi:MAG: hypothetical protein QOF51_290 [Chloroflexota bacterium]|jgi:hypothetical protein|nr:hypothetical protein [Chloroflexota bacterium]
MKQLALVLVLAFSMTAAPVALAAPSVQPFSCPLIDAAAVSSAIGAPVTLVPFAMIDDGSSVQCLFQGSGDLSVVTGRRLGFFGTDQSGAFTPDQLDRVKGEINGEVDFTPVDGVGDAAVWATFRDRGTAPDNLGRLLVKRGLDLITVGITEGPGAVTPASALAQVLVAA